MTIQKEKIDEINNRLAALDATEILQWALREFGAPYLSLASSFGQEDQVLTDMLLSLDPASRIFTLDTGRLFQETYDVMQQSVEKYGIHYEMYAPEPLDLAKLVAVGGPNLFYKSIEDRKQCCEIRKIRPLKKALQGLKAWICGLRMEQSLTRHGVEAITWDQQFGIYKICPLYRWKEAEVRTYIRDHKVPYNVLFDRGFSSIGCAPCTRAVNPGEDVRAGRWWWEAPEQKECGLHRAADGSLHPLPR
jgi:phosphoadenosine phosphosulfate reductase